jgi:hypothetical protein
MRNTIVVALALVLGLWLAALPAAQAAQTGTIEGTITNGTEDGGSVADLTVTLHKWQEDVEGSQVETTTADSTGAFQFEGFEIADGYLYGVSVLYEDVHYWSGTLPLSEDNPEATSVQVNVYETTASADDIKIILDHVALVANQETQFLEVWNVVQFDNQGDRTYVGSDEGTEEGTRLTVRFPLPAGATRIEALEGMQFETLRLTGDGFADTEPLEPGETSISFVYDLEYADGERTFQKIVQYPTDKISVLTPRGGIDVVSPDLPSREETESEVGAMTVLSRDNVSAGTSIDIQVSGIASGDGDGLAPEDVLLPLTIALVAVALGLALGYPLIRRRMAAGRGGQE